MPTAATMAAPRAAAPNAKQAAAVAPRPFRVGVQPVDETGMYDETRSTTTSTVDLPTLSVPATGFLRGLNVWIVGTTAGNSAAVTYAADGPFNVLDTIEFDDVNNKPIVGPFSGYDLYTVNKYGGYKFSDDAKASPVYSATTGAGGTGGSFQFVLSIPIELVPRDALGSLPNKASNSTFKLKMRLAATATVYGTAPTNAPSVRVRVQPDSWWDPDATDLRGRPLAQQPPAVSTTQYWSKVDITVNAGTINPMLSRVGFLIRNLIFILRDNSSSRTQGEADFPDPFTLQFEANVMVSRYKALWQHFIAQSYGYTGASFDAVGAKDNGVYVLPFNNDFGPKPGWETRRGYLATSPTSRLQVRGTVAGSNAHTLTVITNDVAPANGDDQSITV